MNKIYKVRDQMISYNGKDVRRINHSIKVHSFASHIAAMEGLDPEETEIVEIASLLHDIGIHNAEEKYNSNAGSYQEIEGPPVAEKLLKSIPLNVNAVSRILFLIGNHHTYGKIDNKDFQILVEADFLVNIFEDSMTPDQIVSIKNKIFKTKSGLKLLEQFYQG